MRLLFRIAQKVDCQLLRLSRLVCMIPGWFLEWFSKHVSDLRVDSISFSRGLCYERTRAVALEYTYSFLFALCPPVSSYNPPLCKRLSFLSRKSFPWGSMRIFRLSKCTILSRSDCYSQKDYSVKVSLRPCFQVEKYCASQYLHCKSFRRVGSK